MSHSLVPVLAFLGPETWIILVVAGGVLIFGADKLPKLARSAGQAKKEFLVGQAEADIAAENARADARKRAEAQAATAAGTSETSAAPAPGTSGTTTAHPL
jgi:sec-independent protein translocase protein TatA